MNEKPEPRKKVGFTLRRKHVTLLKVLAKCSGITQGEVLDYLLESAKQDIRNVARKLKETVDKEREINFDDIDEE